jgi:hypothetical protein
MRRSVIKPYSCDERWDVTSTEQRGGGVGGGGMQESGGVVLYIHCCLLPPTALFPICQLKAQVTVSQR